MSSSLTDRFIVFNDDGGIVPTDAYQALRMVMDAGHNVALDGAGVVVERGRGLPPIDPEHLAALRRWRYHIRMLLAFYAQAVAESARRAAERASSRCDPFHRTAVDKSGRAVSPHKPSAGRRAVDVDPVVLESERQQGLADSE